MLKPESTDNILVVSGIDVESPIAWTYVLMKHAKDMQGFEGNIANAATLMAKFGKGRNCIKEYFADKVELTYPDMGLMYQDRPDRPNMFHVYSSTSGRKAGATVIQKGYLEELSLEE